MSLELGKMKRPVPIPREDFEQLKRGNETGIGYQVVSVDLKDGRHFGQVIASEGHIIAVKGYGDVPFGPDEIERVILNHHKRWNFRESSDVRRRREKLDE